MSSISSQPSQIFTATPSPANTTPITTSGRPSDESNMSKEFSLDGIPRSASYTQLPATRPQDASYERNGMKRTFSEHTMAGSRANTFRQASSGSASQQGNRSVEPNLYTGVKRGLSLKSTAEPKITISQFTLSTTEDSSKFSSEADTKNKAIRADQVGKTRSVTSSVSRFARQSWIRPSRSPSPSRRRAQERNGNGGDALGDHPERDPLSTWAADGSTNAASHTSGQPESESVRHTKSRRPLSSFISPKSSENRAPSVPPIPKSYSTDRLPSSSAHTSAEIPPNLPKSRSYERLQINVTESPKRKDDLWSAFRALDGDFQKFSTKPSNLKCAVIRSGLLPFLRAHTEPLTNFTLRPEDLDRRANILNKWWSGLLEMLNGRNGESVSGSDRPTVLDAVTAIMLRPEWSVLPSISPLRSARPSLKSRSTTSLGSTMSDFLADSVVHNIKNTYVSNLLAQMAFVVNKMSIRSVPASVVSFCGKATAYAFFYCDGVAEILVRLWSITPDMIKRAQAAHGFKKGVDVRQIVEKFSGRFPACLRKLTFTSLRLMERHLRANPHAPVVTSYIPWNGPWTGRWAGRDTDLFFTFTKHYYDLLSQHLPIDMSQEEKFFAPSYALVQAQLLTLLKGTISRTNNQPVTDPFKVPSSDDSMAETDVSATLLPISPINMNRSMAENRLIMLLRDCLSENATITSKARELFAESFQSLMKAAALQTSRFDHLACFTLCDFLEEAIVIFVRYSQSANTTLSSLDWAFWFEVFRLMMESNNSMTEIRVCAFVYGLWGTITSDSTRRREVCLEWLLSEQNFLRQFNHWCPMVRAFYMRLLVWRIGRLDSAPSEDDIEILNTLSQRLNSVWSHLLWLQDSAEKQGGAAPSTAPCSPAPSRCLLIIRNDQPTSPGMFLSFDSILSSSPNHTSGLQRPMTEDSMVSSSRPTSAQSHPLSDKNSGSGKRRWGMLKQILPFTNFSRSSNLRLPVGDIPPSSIMSSDTTAAGAQSGPPRSATYSPAKAVTYRSHSFKFSLEWFENGNIPTKDRKLSPPQLPSPAQLFLESSGSISQDSTPQEPKGDALGPSKYAGRALAEWAQLIGECHNFFERRKIEGVPDNSKVETPTLTVEPFRRPG